MVNHGKRKEKEGESKATLEEEDFLSAASG